MKSVRKLAAKATARSVAPATRPATRASRSFRPDTIAALFMLALHKETGSSVRAFNFSPGPAMLPLAVLEQARDELTDWRGSGMSVMEISHRSRAFLEVAAQAEADVRELLAVPSHYKVLFLQGGASGQFSAIPLNLAPGGST